MRRLRSHSIVGLAFAFLFGVSNWFVTGDSSPLHEYFLWHGGLPNLFSRVHIGPYIVGMVVSGNVHQPSPVGFLAAAALQWFVVGFLLSSFFTGFSVKRPDNAA